VYGFQNGSTGNSNAICFIIGFTVVKPTIYVRKA